MKAKEITFLPTTSTGPKIQFNSRAELYQVARLLKKPVIVGALGDEYVFDGNVTYRYKVKIQ